MAPTIQIDFEHVLHAYKTVSTPHTKVLYFQQIIRDHSCFNEIKWKDTPPKVRPKKFGAGTDMSDEGVFKKDLTSLLNKVTVANLQSVKSQVVTMFRPEFIDIFVSSLWSYFKIQPSFQDVYIQLLREVLTNISYDNACKINLIWQNIWDAYRRDETWKISNEVIGRLQLYDDFCDYIKEKKRLNAEAEGFSRLLIEGVISDPDKYSWVDDVINWCSCLDITNVNNKKIIDSCVEQIRDFCKHDYTSVPDSIVDKLEILNTHDLQKATYFKIKDFIEGVKKK